MSAPLPAPTAPANAPSEPPPWRRTGALVLALAACLGASLAPGLDARAAPPPVRGYALAPHFEGVRSEAQVLGMVEAIAQEGATHLQVVVQWGQADVRASALAPYPWGTDDAEVARVVAHARRLGLEVLIFPVVHLAHTGPGEWRGKLAPADPEAWWRSYTRFILHYAELGARHGASWISLGSELSALEDQTARWQRLAADVRARFKGRLTYSANWDHFAQVTFWDAVDAVGVNGYFPLSRVEPPDPAGMVEAWRLVRDRLKHWREATGRTDRPLWLTEVGYPSMAGAARRPYHHAPDQPVDLEVQRQAFAALADAWRDDPALGGVFIWAWTGDGGPADRGYMLRGKPALGVVRGWLTPNQTPLVSTP